MATFIVVEGLKPYDGRYELDWEFTTRHFGWVKRLSGHKAGEMFDQIESGQADAELVMVWVLVALHQAGRLDASDVPTVWDRLIDAPFGTHVKMETIKDEEPEGDEASPPQESSSLNGDTSGRSSSPTSETLHNAQKASGNHLSDSSESGQEMLAN